MKTRSDYITAAILIAGALIGAWVLQAGITGLVTLDLTGTICETNGDCTQGLVCCYAGPEALCMSAERCEELAQLPVVETPKARQSLVQVWSGLLILLVIASLALFVKKRRAFKLH